MSPISSSLSHITLLRDLPEAARAALAAEAIEKRLSRREVASHKGDTLKFFPLLLEGRLQGIDFTVDGREVGLYFVGPGEFYGETSLIDRTPMTETVIALAPSILLMLPRERTRKLMFSTPEVAEKVALRLTARLRAETTQRLLLALPNPMQRVCAQLLNLARTDSPDEHRHAHETTPHIACAPTHQEIAIMINSSRETVTRAFQQLQSQALVKRDGTRLLLLKPDVLARMAGAE